MGLFSKKTEVDQEPERKMEIVWSPKPDITTYELALLAPGLVHREASEHFAWFTSLPEPCKRHLRIRRWSRTEGKWIDAER